MPVCDAPIGIFDSGVGGLSVLNQIRARLPAESFIYIADSQHAPYGDKTPDFIRQRSLELTGLLVSHGAKLIVVACNTATAAAVQTLRETFNVPIVAMEPAVKPAVTLSRNGRIGVLATTGTLSSARFAALLDRFGSETEVHTRSCTGWVELVEAGNWQNDTARAKVSEHVEPLLAQSVDTLILGCTHYPFLKKAIARIAGPDVSIVDTGTAVARRIEGVLQTQGLLAHASCPTERFITSLSKVDSAQRVFERLWGKTIYLETLADVQLDQECPR